MKVKNTIKKYANKIIKSIGHIFKSICKFVVDNKVYLAKAVLAYDEAKHPTLTVSATPAPSAT